MASWPGPRLEDWVADAYIFRTPGEYAAKVRELEPAREYVEDCILADFEPDGRSWRDYRNSYVDLVEDAAARAGQIQ
jgi:hypothetical protein